MMKVASPWQLTCHRTIAGVREKVALQVPRVDESPGRCGPAALKAVLKFHGVEASERGLAGLAGTDAKGTTAQGMVQAARNFGFTAQVHDNATIQQLHHELERGRPCIVNWWSVDDGHYSVVERAGTAGVRMMDPETARAKTMDRATFDRNWFDFDRQNRLVRHRMITIKPMMGKTAEGIKTAISRNVLRRVAESGEPEAKRLISMLAGQGGYKPVLNLGETGASRLAYYEKNIGPMRARMRAFENMPEYATRGSPAWRQAMQDIKAGNMATVEHGAPLSAVQSIHQFGPGSPINGPKNIGETDWVKRLPEESKQLAQHGMYASKVNTQATATYAGRAPLPGQPYETPGKLLVDFPKSMAPPREGSRVEYEIPSAMYRQFARNPRVEKVAELAEDGEHKLQGHINFQGLDIAVENRKGSVRSGKKPDGGTWRTVMRAPYGYFEAPAKGKDGESIDVYVGPKKDAPVAFVVHQHKPDGTGFDEDKVVVGTESEEEAKKLYLQHYDDPKFLGPISSVPVERLKTLLETKQHLHKISMVSMVEELGKLAGIEMPGGNMKVEPPGAPGVGAAGFKTPKMPTPGSPSPFGGIKSLMPKFKMPKVR